MPATLAYMPREKKAPSTTIRVPESFADELEVITDYLDEIRKDDADAVTVGTLLEEWCRPLINKYKQKAIDFRIERLKRMRENG